MKRLCLIFKRIIDVIGSGFGLLLTIPILVIASILIKTTSPGPIFFFQERVGKNGKIFRMIKFRTMRVDDIAEKFFDFTKDQERLTDIGKILRRLKVDELPQLINVFVGDMSLVGPRPTIQKQVESYSQVQRQRLKMRPGMTGLAQVSGNTALSWNQRIEYDVEYIKRFNVWLDFMILIKTVAIIIFGEGKFRK